MNSSTKQSDKQTSLNDITSFFTNGMSLMVGGFGGVGTPPTLIRKILEEETDNMTVICNDAGFPNIGIGQLVTKRKVAALYTSHIGSNPNAGRQMTEGTLDVHFFPQGTLAEKIRAGGVGLGGVFVDVGIGNEFVEKNKQTLTVNDKKYLVEPSLIADVSIIYAKKADRFGNLTYDTTARNTNPLVAMAGNITIAEVEEIVPIGDINPEEVVTSGVFVDHIVQSEGVNWSWAWEKK